MTGTPFDAAREALRTHFGYDDFRPGQVEIVRAVLEGRDVVGVMPTGGGKSVCYQVPALLREGLTIVVSPLIALMKDQVDALLRASIRATFVNSMIDFREMNERIEKARHGWFRLMYVAPERFGSRAFLERIRGVRIALFAVDEAHCISEWGHDFRPSYLRLREAIDALGAPQVVALTATATPDVREDIKKSLALNDPAVIVRGFHRPNLSFRVIQGGSKRDFIFSESAKGECGIIYAGTRATVEELAQFLKRHAVAAEAYHAGLGDGERRDVQERFMSGETRVITATSAFGMGIDKPDVRFVIHHDMPGTIEQYYQEAGRAGRDGKDSRCILLYHPGDRSLPEFFLRQTFPDRSVVQGVYSQLHHAAGTQLGQSYSGLVSHTPQSLAAMMGKVSESAVRGALDLLEHNGYIRRIQSQHAQSTIRFLLEPDGFRQWLIESASDILSPVATALLRTAGGEAFFAPVEVSLPDIASRTNAQEEDLHRGLLELHALRIVDYHPGRAASGIALLGPRAQARDLAIDYGVLEKRMRHQLEKLNAMEHYILGTECRRNVVLEYFEERDIVGTCGTCDVCTSVTVAAPDNSARTIFDAYARHILRAVAELDGKFGRTTIAELLHGARTKRIAQYRLHECLGYGVARDVDRRLVLEAIDTMIGLGWLSKTDSLHPALHITDTGRHRLGETVQARALPHPAADGDIPVNDRILYEALRAVRRRVAAEQNVPSHALLPDAVLRRIGNALPPDEDAMLAIEGMGPTTFRKCGRQMLVAIREHVEQLQLAGAMSTARTALAALSPSLKATFELCAQGLDIAGIAERRELTEGTVSQHLAELVSSGAIKAIDQFVPPDHQKQIRKAASIVRTGELKKIKGLIEEDVSYAEIRVMLAVLTREKKKP